MTCSRWIAVCTDMLDHPVVGMDKPRHMAAWLWLLTNAAWKPKRRSIGGKTYTEQRGELVASLRFIADATHLSVKEVRTFLDRLVREDMISLSNTGTGTGITSITICNYEKYQTAKEEKGTAGAQQGHSRGTNLTRDTKVTSKEEVNNTGQSNHAAHEPSPDRPAEKGDLKTAFNGATATMIADVAKWMGVSATDPLAAKWLQSTLNANGQQATATAYAMLAEKQAGNERIVNPLTWWGKTATSLKAKQPAPAASGIRCSPGTMRNARPAPEVGHA
jgi:hypothetical protein